MSKNNRQLSESSRTNKQTNKQTVTPDFIITPTVAPVVAAASPTAGKVITPNFAVFFPKRITQWFHAHELQHIEQFKVVARHFAGLSDDIGKGLENFKKFMNEQTIFKSDEFNKFNKEFYTQVVKKEGVIKPGTKEAQKAEKYMQAMRDYPEIAKMNPVVQFAEGMQNGAKFKAAKDKGNLHFIKFLIDESRNAQKAQKQLQKSYNSNLLETEARQASRDYAKSRLKEKAKNVAGKIADKLGLRNPDAPRGANNRA